MHHSINTIAHTTTWLEQWLFRLLSCDVLYFESCDIIPNSDLEYIFTQKKKKKKNVSSYTSALNSK